MEVKVRWMNSWNRTCVSRKWRRVSALEDEMLRGVDQLLLLLSVAAPQQEHHMRAFTKKCLDLRTEPKRPEETLRYSKRP